MTLALYEAGAADAGGGVSGAVRPVRLDPRAQAHALGAALDALGFTAEVLSARDHQQHPCVIVTSGPGRIALGACYVYAAPSDDGSWLFWRSSLEDPLDTEPVAPISEVSVAADAISRELTRVRIPAAVRRAV